VQIPVQVSDLVDPSPGFSCAPSGGTFSIGVTQVTCTALDFKGNTRSCTTSVAVGTKILIDVRPGKCPNLIKFPSNSLIPVAIMGSRTFDVTQILRSSITLDGVPVDPDGQVVKDCAGLFDPKSWWAKRFAELRCARKSKDGYKDLKVYFNQTSIANVHRVTRFFSVAYVTLKGTLINGLPFEGQDLVVISTWHKPPRPWPRWRPGHDGEDDRDDDDDDDCEYWNYRRSKGWWRDD